MLLFFVLIVGTLCVLDLYIYNKNITPFIVIAAPYLFIILINNLFAVRIGFFPISDSVILMLLCGLLLFHLGTFLMNCTKQGKTLRREIAFDSNVKRAALLDYYDFRAMMGYALFVEVIVLIRVLSVSLLNGFGFFSSQQGEGYLLSGPLGHLLLTIYPLIPLIFYKWLNEKKCHYLFIVLCGISLFFLTYVKYHVLCLIGLIFLFVVSQEKQYLIKGAVLLLIIVVAVFVCNYALSFLFLGIKGYYKADFYIGHLWKYIAGSLIHDNVIFTNGIQFEASGLYKIANLFFALPNMFIGKIWGVELFKDTGRIAFTMISTRAEYGNVIDFIGHLFPSDAHPGDYIIFMLTMILFGFFMAFGFLKGQANKTRFSICPIVLMTFLCLFSFYAVYGALKVPWEVAVWAIIMPRFFDGRIKVRIESHSKY